MNNSSLLSLPALAQALNLPKGWLREQADAGRIPHLKVNRRYRFDRGAVEAALRDRASREGVRHD